MSLKFMRLALEKLAEGVSRGEAVGALSRLRELEKSKPSGEALARGALTGALVGPGAQLASQAVSGDLGKGVRGGVRQALTAKTKGGKALGLGKALLGGVRGLGGSAASGAIFGAGLPTVRAALDRNAEKAKLRGYLGTSRGGRTRQSVKKALGV